MIMMHDWDKITIGEKIVFEELQNVANVPKSVNFFFDLRAQFLKAFS